MDKEILSIWAWRLALGTTILVGILSWQTDVGFLWIIIRMILSFLFIYGLSYGSLYGFEKAAPPTEKIMEDIPGTGRVNGTERGIGALLDVAVGQEEMESDTPSPEEGGVTLEQGGSSRAGQVDPDLSQGMPDAEKQAEMVRRMGWGE